MATAREREREREAADRETRRAKGCSETNDETKLTSPPPPRQRMRSLLPPLVHVVQHQRRVLQLQQVRRVRARGVRRPRRWRRRPRRWLRSWRGLFWGSGSRLLPEKRRREEKRKTKIATNHAKFSPNGKLQCFAGDCCSANPMCRVVMKPIIKHVCNCSPFDCCEPCEFLGWDEREGARKESAISFSLLEISSRDSPSPSYRHPKTCPGASTRAFASPHSAARTSSASPTRAPVDRAAEGATTLPAPTPWVVVLT